MASFFQSIIIETSESNLVRLIEFLKNNFVLSEEDIIDYSLSTTISLDEGKSSIGIKEVQELTSWNSLKSENVKIALIKDADKLTVQAQNSLLKIVEEPNLNNLIILQTKNIKSILETIRSRCKKYSLKSIHDEVAEIDVENFLKSTYSQRKVILQDSMNKLSKSAFLETVIEKLMLYFVEHRELFTKETFNIMIELLEYIYLANRRSVNFKLLVDYLNFNLIKIK